jgi:antitoxin component of MazEF toxin-antitoxin module
MINQRVFKAGNSGVVSIPRDLAEEYGYEYGLMVQVVPSGYGDDLIIRKVTKEKKETSKISSEFKKWLKSAISEDKEILNELA